MFQYLDHKIQAFYEKRVYKKLTSRSFQKQETFPNAKETISFTISRITIIDNFRNIVNKFYTKICLVAIIILICRTLLLSITIPFKILRFASNKKKKRKNGTRKVYYLRNF